MQIKWTFCCRWKMKKDHEQICGQTITRFNFVPPTIYMQAHVFNLPLTWGQFQSNPMQCHNCPSNHSIQPRPATLSICPKMKIQEKYKIEYDFRIMVFVLLKTHITSFTSVVRMRAWHIAKYYEARISNSFNETFSKAQSAMGVNL